MPAWRRVCSGLALALIALIGVAVAALARLPHAPAWSTVVIGGAAFAIGLIADPFKALASSWLQRPGQQHTTLLRETRMHDRRGQLIRVKDCKDLLALGVHPAASPDGTPSAQVATTPYVERDAEMALREVFTSGGLVIIQGTSTSGKSRLAYEAMRRYAPNWWLIVPSGPTALRKMIADNVPVKKAVIWLDDVETQLVAGDLDAAVLDTLCPVGRHDVVLLATLRGEARREFAPSKVDNSIRHGVDEVLRRARVISLDSALNDVELERAEKLRRDQRIAAALDQTSDAGFAEYLAAGPDTVARWLAARHGEHPVAAAVISAAVDARRIGYFSPMSRSLLEQLHVHYLDSRTRRHPSSASFDDALSWAIVPVNGASACLTSIGEDFYQPFDYLVDHAQHKGNLNDIPSAMWSALVGQAEPIDLTAIGVTAYNVKDIDTSEKAFRKAAVAGFTAAMNNLGLLLAESGRVEEAQHWYRLAAQAGHIRAMHNLGLLEKDRGQTDEAERWYRQAAQAGYAAAMNNLGLLLAETGRTEEAEHWYRVAVGAGDVTAANNLGSLLHRTSRIEEAETFWIRAAGAGQAAAMYNLGLLAKTRGQLDEAKHWYEEAADAGHAGAMNNLALLLTEIGRTEQAESWYRRAIDDGHTDAMFNLGVHLTESGRTDEAEQWFQRVVGTEDPAAMNSLGTLLQRNGKPVEAEQWYRRAIEAGDVEAMNNLGSLLAETGRSEQAEEWHRRAADAGHAGAMNNLAVLLDNNDRAEEAERWYRGAADVGHVTAMSNLGNLLYETNRAEEAEQWWRRASKNGNTPAMINLGSLLQEKHQIAEAMDLYLRAAEVGDTEAMNNLGNLLKIRGDIARAEFWFRRSIESGNVKAMYNLGALQKRSENVEEAEYWFRKASESGHKQAMLSLYYLMEQTGRPEEAAQWAARFKAVRKSSDD